MIATPAVPPVPAAGATGVSGTGAPRTGRELFRRLIRSRTFVVGAGIVVFWAFCALFGSVIERFDPLGQSLGATNLPPSGAHLFGTDGIGEDVFSRVIAGARDILTIAPLATILGTAAGTALGLVMGYFRGLVDSIVSRVVEAVLALPVVVVAFLLIAAIGPSARTLVLVIGLVFAPLIARTVRSAVLAERDLDYVAAAHLRGERAPHIMFVEILPNVLPPILVEFTVRLGYAIFAVATLSFLGLGVQLPTPDWGADIANSYGNLTSGYWWQTLFPALAIATLVVAVNLVADSLEAVLAG